MWLVQKKSIKQSTWWVKKFDKVNLPAGKTMNTRS